MSKGTMKRPWEEMEKKSRIGWMVLSVFIVLFMVVICIWQGATRKEPVTTTENSLTVLSLDQAYENQEEIETFFAFEPLELENEASFLPEITGEEEYFLPVYQSNIKEHKKNILKEGQKLPLEFSGTKGVSQGFEDKQEQIQDYLKRMYQINFFEGENEAVFKGNGFDRELKSNYQVIFHPQGSTVEENLLNYSMKRVVIYIQEDGKIIDAYKDAVNEFVKIGDYPIIPEKMARQLLDEGRYFTNVPGDYPGEELIAISEIQYRNDGSSLKIPYYRFLIEIPKEGDQDAEGELKEYGAYYVPAIEGKFLDNLSLWQEIEEPSR